MRETKYCVQFNWCCSFMTVYMDLCSAYNNSIVLDSWAHHQLELERRTSPSHTSGNSKTRERRMETAEWNHHWEMGKIPIPSALRARQQSPGDACGAIHIAHSHSPRQNGKMHGWRKQTIISIFANILLLFDFFYFVVVGIVAALEILCTMRPVALLLCVGCNELSTYTARWRLRCLPCIVSVLCSLRNAKCSLPRRRSKCWAGIKWRSLNELIAFWFAAAAAAADKYEIL